MLQHRARHREGVLFFPIAEPVASAPGSSTSPAITAQVFLLDIRVLFLLMLAR